MEKETSIGKIENVQTIKTYENYRKYIFILGVGLLSFSLFQIAYIKDTSPDNNTEYGLGVFLFGWINVFGAGVSWLANPLLILSWKLLFKNIKYAMILSFSALVFALSFLTFDEILANEGGGHCGILSYGTGYWLWIASCLSSFTGTAILYMFSNRRIISIK
jgi:hypothetical protein